MSPDAFYTDNYSRVFHAALAYFLVSVTQCTLGNPSPMHQSADPDTKPYPVAKLDRVSDTRRKAIMACNSGRSMCR